MSGFKKYGVRLRSEFGLELLSFEWEPALPLYGQNYPDGLRQMRVTTRSDSFVLSHEQARAVYAAFSAWNDDAEWLPDTPPTIERYER